VHSRRRPRVGHSPGRGPCIHPWIRGLALVAFSGASLLGVMLGAGCADGTDRGSSGVGEVDPATQAGGTLSGEPARLLSELEGLSFVPEGRTFIGSALDVGSSVDLLVDRFEVHSALWGAWTPATNPIPIEYRPDFLRPDLRPGPEAWTEEVPAVGMTLAEARAFAERRAMRLLTFEEWLWCAVGPTCRRVPAGRRQRGFANTLDTELYKSTPVGSFESGQTPETAIYDMLGNVWEWIEPPPERLRSNWTVYNDSAMDSELGFSASTWVLGGSFMTPEGPLYTRDLLLLALAVTRGHRSSEIGLRCCVDADVYLAALPSGARLSGRAQGRLEAVGARWGLRATGLLDELLESRPRHPWLTMLRRGAGRETNR
jgi:hypothetical protein